MSHLSAAHEQALDHDKFDDKVHSIRDNYSIKAHRELIVENIGEE